MRFYCKLQDYDVATQEPCGQPRYRTGETSRLEERHFAIFMLTAENIWFVVNKGEWKELHREGEYSNRLVSCDISEAEKAVIVLSAQGI